MILIFGWFKYLKPDRTGRVITSPEYDSSRIILNSSKWNNLCSNNPLVFGSHRPINDHKSSFKWRIDYCGIFYFFIKYFRIKQEHYKNDIKPTFIKWVNLTFQPLDYHYINTFDTLFITITDTIREVDHEGMATSHLKGYKEYDLLLLIIYLVNQYNTNLQDFILHITSRIQSDVAASVPIISHMIAGNHKKQIIIFCQIFYDIFGINSGRKNGRTESKSKGTNLFV